MTATLPRPGYAVQSIPAPALPFTGIRTGRWFPTGLALKGPITAQPIGSLSQFEAMYGARQAAYSTLYDALDEYFSDGGIEAIVARVVGPAAVNALAKLKNATAENVLKVEAKGPGEYANGYKIVVTEAADKLSFVIQVQTSTGEVLETSPSFFSNAAAVAWSTAVSATIIITLEAAVGLPKTETTELLTGKDDKASIVDASWVNALNQFLKDMGPGQVSQVGRTTKQAYVDTLAHAYNFNRFALLDAPNSATAATLTAAALELRSPITQDTYGMMVGRWPVIPGILPNTSREVPPSAAVAAFIARSEAAGNSPNRPAAGLRWGISRRGIALANPPYENVAKQGPDITRDEMYSKSINLFQIDNNQVELWGWRTLTDPAGATADWINAGNARLRMAIAAKAAAIAKTYVLDEVDGVGIVLHEFEADLKKMLGEYWPSRGLYGATPEQAFIVNVGPQINTPQSLANLELKAEIGLRMNPDAEMVIIQIAKVPITQQLAQAA